MKYNSLFGVALLCGALAFSCVKAPTEPEGPAGEEPSNGPVKIVMDGKFDDWNNTNIVSSTSFMEGKTAISCIKGHMDADYIYIYIHCVDKASAHNVRICIDHDASAYTGSSMKGVCGSGYTGMINVTSLTKPDFSVFYEKLDKGDKVSELANFVTGKYAYDDSSETSLQVELAIDRIAFEQVYKVDSKGVRFAVYAVDKAGEITASIPNLIPLVIPFVESAVIPEPVRYVESYSAPEPPFEYKITYEYDPTDFANPERGPYSHRGMKFEDGKIPDIPSAENMAALLDKGCSLPFVLYYLCDFMDCDISQEALDAMWKHMENLRASGCKCVLRFGYTWDGGAAVTEPEVDQVLRHVEQVTPMIKEFWDVIFVWQCGFIGPWGEMHSSTHFKNSEDVNRLIRAELDAMPAARQIAVRTNNRKTSFLGTKAADTLTVATAYNGSDAARIGFYNDCFLATSSDGGTFSSASDRSMWKAESNYVLMGGESCYMNEETDIYCQCENSYKDLKDYHWDYLSNHHYIVNVWKEQGCVEDATARVGYRFVLNGASFDGSFASGNSWTIKLSLTNYGYASLSNERHLEFILRSVSNPSDIHVLHSSIDPRIWKGSHSYVVEETFIIPDGIVPGDEYELLLNLPDMAPTLYGRPSYSVRLANKDVWEKETGYNHLAVITAE